VVSYKIMTAVRGRASRTAVGGESENRYNLYFTINATIGRHVCKTLGNPQAACLTNPL